MLDTTLIAIKRDSKTVSATKVTPWFAMGIDKDPKSKAMQKNAKKLIKGWYGDESDLRILTNKEFKEIKGCYKFLLKPEGIIRSNKKDIHDGCIKEEEWKNYPKDIK